SPENRSADLPKPERKAPIAKVHRYDDDARRVLDGDQFIDRHHGQPRPRRTAPPVWASISPPKPSRLHHAPMFSRALRDLLTVGTGAFHHVYIHARLAVRQVKGLPQVPH